MAVVRRSSQSASIFVVLARWHSEAGGGGAVQDSSIFARRPCGTQTSLKYSMRISTGSSFSGRATALIERKTFRARSFLIGQFFRLEFITGRKTLVDICRHPES